MGEERNRRPAARADAADQSRGWERVRTLSPSLQIETTYLRGHIVRSQSHLLEKDKLNLNILGIAFKRNTKATPFRTRH